MSLEKEFNKVGKKLERVREKDNEVTYMMLAMNGDEMYGKAEMSPIDLAYMIKNVEGLEELLGTALWLLNEESTEEE